MNKGALIALGAAAGAWYWYTQQSAETEATEETDTTSAEDWPGSSLVDTVIESVGSMGFNISINLPGNKEYVDACRVAEIQYGIPYNLLVAQAYQESRFNPNAKNKKSGAAGILQFMPATAAELGIDPYNPFQAITGAARYMAQLYKSTGDWKLALAAYNWGIGNVQRKGIAKAPKETRDYMAQVSTNAGYA